jgi:hypothetical protein
MDDASGQPNGKREFGIAASSACPAHGILDDRLAEQPIKATASGSRTAGLPGAIIDDLAKEDRPECDSRRDLAGTGDHPAP